MKLNADAMAGFPLPSQENDVPRSLVDECHQLHLVRPFLDVFLVDTQRVDLDPVWRRGGRRGVCKISAEVL